MKLWLAGPVIKTRSASFQAIRKLPPSRIDLGRALGQVAPHGRDQRGAGAAAAGLGQPGAALPDAQPDRAPVAHLGDADVGALGEQGIGLELRPELGERHRLGIVDEEHRVRIADVERDRRRRAARGRGRAPACPSAARAGSRPSRSAARPMSTL